jgi:hypothetical protein
LFLFAEYGSGVLRKDVTGTGEGGLPGMHHVGTRGRGEHAMARVRRLAGHRGRRLAAARLAAALSAANAWAVGGDAKGRSMALHWNGRTWIRVATPNVKPNQLNSALFDVQATSAASPWAVGEYGLSNQVQRTLVFRCR